MELSWWECIRAGSAHNWPAPPEIAHKLTEAKDIERAIKKVSSGGWGCRKYVGGREDG